MPTTPCTEMAPTGSSILSLSSETMEATTSRPPTAPIRSLHGRRRQRFSRDRNQAGQRTVERHREIGFAEPEPGQQQGEHRPPAAAMLVLTNTSATAVGFADIGDLQFGAAVKAEPAQPEDQGAERRERQVAARDGVDLALLAVLAFACAQQQHAGQGRGGAAHVHDTGTREIEKPSRVEKAAAPFPVTLHRVDEAGQDDGKGKERPELHALGHGARHDGHGGCDEHDLEEEVRQVGVVGLAAARDDICRRVVAVPSMPMPRMQL